MTADDIFAFGEILAAYDEIIPLSASEDSLRNYGELLYRGSLGCIGLLRGWLKRACAMASNQGLNRQLLERTILSDNDLQKITAEILIGEQLLASSMNYETEPLETTSEQPKPKKGNRHQAKPFQRRPVRYKKGNRLPEGA